MSVKSCLDQLDQLSDKLEPDEYQVLRSNCLQQQSSKGRLSNILPDLDDPIIIAAGGLAAGGVVVGAVVIGAAAVGVGFLAVTANNRSQVVQTNYTRDSSGNLINQQTIVT